MAKTRMPTFDDILDAAKNRGPVRRTGMTLSQAFSNESGGEVWLKAEHTQKTGSFKLRGAYNKIRSLSSNGAVVAASAGNHAQGVAYAAAAAGLRATIVMPRNASPAKVAATRRYGAEVVSHGESYGDAATYAKTLPGTHIHAFDDPLVVAGQGVVGLEILEQLPDVEEIYVPAGGGGLLAGIALAVRHERPDVTVCGVRTYPGTMSDGTAVDGFGDMTGHIIRECGAKVVKVDDSAITRAMFILMERHKMIVEPAGAVALGHLLCVESPHKTACVVSGGNIDMWLLSQIVNHGLAMSGRLLSVSMLLPDRPGVFSGIMRTISDAGANLVDMSHDRLTVGVGRVRVTASLETDGRDGTKRLVRMLRDSGLEFDVL